MGGNAEEWSLWWRAYEGAKEAAERSFKREQRAYIEEFLRLRAAVDLLRWGVFPNAKEITESMAAFKAVVRYVPWFDLGEKRSVVVVVGDGGTPRTGALFAVRTASTVMSVDPRCKKGERLRDEAERLWVLPYKVEEWEKWPHLFDYVEQVVVVAVHSHALLEQAMLSLWTMVGGSKGDKLRRVRVGVVAIPCCVPQVMKIYQEGWGRVEPDVEYRDVGIWSPKNAVKVWNSLALENGVWKKVKP